MKTWFKALTKGKKALVVTAAAMVVAGAVAGSYFLVKKIKAVKALPANTDEPGDEKKAPEAPAK